MFSGHNNFNRIISYTLTGKSDYDLKGKSVKSGESQSIDNDMSSSMNGEERKTMSWKALDKISFILEINAQQY